MRTETIIESARRLSSGTIATLIRDNRYTAIDKAQAAFVSYIAAAPPGIFQTWQEAWARFAEEA